MCVQVIHSELDYRLSISEGMSAFNVLQSRGVPSKLLVFTDENHVSCSNHISFTLHPLPCRHLPRASLFSGTNKLTDSSQWVLKPENSLVWHREVLGWINQYTGIET